MDRSSQKVNVAAIDGWTRNACSLAEKSKNDRVKQVLSSIKQISDDFQLVAQKMNSLTSLKIDLEDLEVTDLISDLMKISSLDTLICIKFAKINFKLFYNNAEVTKSTKALENFVDTLCTLIENSFNSKMYSQNDESIKFARIQLCIIVELQNVFSIDGFMGNKCIINLFFKLINVDICELGEIFGTILNNQLKHPAFCEDMFSIEPDASYADFLRYCLMIIQTINSQELSANIITSSKESSFPCKLITSLSKNLYAMEADAEIYDLLIAEIADLMIKSNLSQLNFKVIEQQLMEGIICEEYDSSVVCFNIMCQYLLKIESQNAVKSYFGLFQDLLLLMWNPCLQFCENRQVYVASMLKMLYKMHKDTLFNSIVPNLQSFFTENNLVASCDFDKIFSKLMSNPTAENYYEMVNALQCTIDEKYSKDLLNLIQLAGNSDWNICSSMVIKIIKLIADAKDPQQKMLYLLKLNPLDNIKLSGENIPLEIIIKLLEMSLTFMSKATEYDGLKSYIKNLLDLLLDRDISVRRLYLNLRMSKTIMIKEEDTIIGNIEDILKTSIKLCHVCSNELSISQKIESSQLNNLEKMLLYSKYLSDQKLSARESEIVNEIILNLQKVHS